VLIGLAVQRCAEAEAESPLRVAWRRYLLVLSPILIGAPLGVAALALFGAPHPILEPWVEPPLAAMAYTASFALLAGLILRMRSAASAVQLRLSVMALVAFLAIGFGGVVTDARVQRSLPVAESVRLLKEKLPPGQPLVSLGHVDCLFPYYYGPPTITPLPWPTAAAAHDPRLTYFCFNYVGDSRPTLPFAWQEIDAICMDRNRQETPERVVVVGLRLPAHELPLPALPVRTRVSR